MYSKCTFAEKYVTPLALKIKCWRPDHSFITEFAGYNKS